MQACIKDLCVHGRGNVSECGDGWRDAPLRTYALSNFVSWEMRVVDKCCTIVHGVFIVRRSCEVQSTLQKMIIVIAERIMPTTKVVAVTMVKPSAPVRVLAQAGDGTAPELCSTIAQHPGRNAS